MRRRRRAHGRVIDLVDDQRAQLFELRGCGAANAVFEDSTNPAHKNRGQKSEIRSQRSEVRGQRSVWATMHDAYGTPTHSELGVDDSVPSCLFLVCASVVVETVAANCKNVFSRSI